MRECYWRLGSFILVSQVQNIPEKVLVIVWLEQNVLGKWATSLELPGCCVHLQTHLFLAAGASVLLEAEERISAHQAISSQFQIFCLGTSKEEFSLLTSRSF